MGWRTGRRLWHLYRDTHLSCSYSFSHCPLTHPLPVHVMTFITQEACLFTKEACFLLEQIKGVTRPPWRECLHDQELPTLILCCEKCTKPLTLGETTLYSHVGGYELGCFFSFLSFLNHGYVRTTHCLFAFYQRKNIYLIS